MKIFTAIQLLLILEKAGSTYPWLVEVLNTEQIDLVCRNLSGVFFGVYDQDGEEYGKKDNSWLASQYGKCLRERDSNVFRSKKVREGYVANYHDRQYKFEFAWPNQTFNLVKTVSLDLKLPDSR